MRYRGYKVTLPRFGVSLPDEFGTLDDAIEVSREVRHETEITLNDSIVAVFSPVNGVSYVTDLRGMV